MSFNTLMQYSVEQFGGMCTQHSITDGFVNSSTAISSMFSPFKYSLDGILLFTPIRTPPPLVFLSLLNIR